MRYAFCLATAFAVASATPSLAAEPESEAVEIPLEEIWAFKMAGTRDIQELDPRVAAEETMITRMGQALFRRRGFRREARDEAGPCFVVNGEGKEALTNAVKVLVDGEEPLESVPAGHDVSLVFYSYPAPGYVFFDSVRRSSDHLTLNYYVMVHQTADITVHFALIPLGKLDAGKFTVDVVEVDGGGPKYDPEQAQQAVCDSCSFVVRDGGVR
jgi:hypothetical protein